MMDEKQARLCWRRANGDLVTTPWQAVRAAERALADALDDGLDAWLEARPCAPNPFETDRDTLEAMA